MVTNIITYLIIGVAFNFVYDSIISEFGMNEEDTRLNMKERGIVVLIWPLAVLFFVYLMIKPFFNSSK